MLKTLLFIALTAVFFADHLIAANVPTFGSPQFVSTAHRVDNMVTGDFDDDGHQDVAVVDSNSGNVEVHFGDGAGGYRSTASSFTITSSNSSYHGIAAADLDGDGKSELIFAASASVLIYERQSDGGFTDNHVTDSHANIIDLAATGIDATKVAVGDLSAAGSRDIVVSDDFGSVGVVWIPNDGAGTFGTPAKFAAGGIGYYAHPVLADVDGDGLDDAVLARQDGVGVLLNKGNGTLDAEVTYGNSALAGFRIQGVAVADVDGDTFPDLVMTGYVHNASTLHDVYSLSVNLSNGGNGTFADGTKFDFLNGGDRIDANTIEAADLNGDGRPEIVTAVSVPGTASVNGFSGFIVTRWTGTGGTLAMADQDNFATNDGISYAALAVGDENEDEHPDVLVGTSATISGSPNHSQFALFQNTTPVLPSGRDVTFAQAAYSVTEGDEVDVPVLRGTSSTGQALAFFSVGGTAVNNYGGNVKNADYQITDPPNDSQTITFADGEFQKNIHITTATNKGSAAAQTIVLTLLTPVGDSDIGAIPATTITINDDQPASLKKPGALTVKPANIIKPVPAPLANNGVKVAGRTGSDWTFSVSQPLPADAFDPAIKVQWSPNGTQWFDTPVPLKQGKGSAWKATTRHPLFPCNKAFFRTLTSAEGYPDIAGAPTQAFAVIGGPELALNASATSDSDSSGDTVHENEVIIYHFIATNVSTTDADATNAVLTVPIPPHTTFLNATNSIAPFKTIADKHGRITAMKWNFASIPKGADKAVDLLVTVDNAAAFSSKDPNAGFGQVISLKGAALDPKNGYNLSALEQGIESSAILRDEIKTRILGSLKLSVHQDVNSVGPGGLISYRLDCENDGGQPLSGAIVTDEIPITTALGIDGLPVRTQLVALYEFNVNGDALNTQLPNPGAFTNPAIIYARTSFIPKIDADNLPIPASALPLVVPIVGAKTGAEVELKDLDQDTVNVLVNDGIIAPAKIKWTMGTIPAAHVAGQSNVRSVAFTVRVPYDIPTVDSNGQPTMVVNGHYSKEKKPTTYLNDHSSYDFFVPGSNLSALYGNPPAALKITIDDSIPSAKPQLGLGKFALGSQTLNNPNFHGNGFATIAGVGDVTTAVEHHGVDFALFYFNSDDAQAPGADAHGVVIHDVIPEGMQLRGFFKQHVGPSLTSGALEVGKTYAIAQFAEGDDFTNVGAASNEPGTAFTATGTTPADWSHGSALNLEGPMFASQFTFYDKNGNIVAGVDPNSNQNNMALVTSMDIRLGSVQNVTLIPKGTGGYVQYTCEATISPTTVIKYPGHEVQGTPGLIHSFGGFEPGQGLSEKLQGFYLTTSDLLAPIQGGPDDVLVRVLADVSWDFPAPERKTSKAKPTDIVAFDFNFTQNGDVTAEGGHVDFVVPQGTTFLNGTVTPPAGAAVSTGTNLVVANGSTQYDCRPTFTDDSSVVTATQTGANVQLALNDVPGHTSRAVRVFLKINSPLDPALAQSHAFVFDNQTTIIAGGSPSSSARISRSVSSSSDEGTAHASGLDPMAVSNTNAPHLSLGRSAPYSVQKGGKFTYTISFANTGGAAATNVNVGMQVPFGTTFVSADNGILRDNILGKPMSNPHPFTATERSKDQVKQTGGGHNILTWHYDSVPAQAVGLIKVTVQCFGSFADDCVRDHSLYINADNAASAVLSPNPIGTWVIGKPFDTSKWEVLQCFCQHLGIAINKQTAPALQAFVNTLTKNSKVQAFGGIDTLSLTNGVKVFQLGNNQVLCISNDGNSLISNDGGTLISNDGGTLVATGAGNAISISNIPSLGTKTAEYLLDHVADVIAAGAGNVVAAGAGNLISNDGGTLLSNHPGGTDASIVSHDGGTVVAAGAGNVIAAGAGNILGVGQAGVVSHDGGTIVSHDGGTLLTSDGSGLTAVGAGQIISNDGNSVISNDGNSLVHAAGGE